MPVHTTYVQLEVDVTYEIEPAEFGFPEQVEILSVTATENQGPGRKQNLLKSLDASTKINIEDEILGESK